MIPILEKAIEPKKLSAGGLRPFDNAALWAMILPLLIEQLLQVVVGLAAAQIFHVSTVLSVVCTAGMLLLGDAVLSGLYGSVEPAVMDACRVCDDGALPARG